MLQYKLIARSPHLLRWYRTRLMLDWDRLQAYLPTRGRVLDVGCGVGSLDYEIGRRSAVDVLGIDVDDMSISLARRYHSRANVEFAHVDLQAVEGKFDCVLFVDVFHHVPPDQYKSLLQACARLLTPGGYALIKDIERRRGQLSQWMDRYLSGCRQVYMHNCDELAQLVSQTFPKVSSEVRFRAPFPHYYIKAGNATAQ